VVNKLIYPAIGYNILKVIEMKCNLCGYDRLSKRAVVYAQHYDFYGNPKPHREIVPLCKDCAERINAGLIERMQLVKKGSKYWWRKEHTHTCSKDGQ